MSSPLSEHDQKYSAFSFNRSSENMKRLSAPTTYGAQPTVPYAWTRQHSHFCTAITFRYDEQITCSFLAKMKLRTSTNTCGKKKAKERVFIEIRFLGNDKEISSSQPIHTLKDVVENTDAQKQCTRGHCGED